VNSNTLISPDGSRAPIRVGEPAWYAWLEAATTFAFMGSAGSFTARKERGGRAGQYWKAYRTRAGQLRRAYLGKSADLTLDRLNDVAAELTRPDVARTLGASVAPAPIATSTPVTPRGSLLMTKLFPPPARPNLVARPHLIRRLQVGFQAKLTLIAAPPGFGKTTLLAQGLGGGVAWANSQSSTPNSYLVAWVSLDSADTDPVRFWSHVIAALDRLSPGVSAPALAALQSPQPPPMIVLLTDLLNALSALPGSALLVLDDYHVITTQPIHDALVFLLDHLPSQLHLVIASRTDPPLPLALLRARGELTELRAADLRFSVDEATIFLTQVMALPLSSPDVATLEGRTEGWIAGLQLAALAMRNHTDLAGFITAFAGSNRFVVDYLAAEVLDRLPAELQRFVLDTAILDRMCGPLCDYVTEIENEKLKINVDGSQKSQFILEELERMNLFLVPLDDARQWYRYHHLFAEVARGRLYSSTSGATVATLHRRASAWYEQAGFVAEAVQHALAAEDWERAADLIEQSGYVGIVRGQIRTVLSWLKGLPDALIRTRPWLCILHAFTLLFTNDQTAAAARLQAAEQRIQAAHAPNQDRTMLGHLFTLRGAIFHFSGDLPGCVTYAQQALELLPETETLSRPLALVLAAHAYRVGGDVTPAAEHLAAAVAEPVRAAGSLLAYLGALLNLAELQVAQGRLHQAAASFRQSAQVALGSGGLHMLVGSPAYYFGMGDLLREWNDLDAAERHVKEGMDLVRGALAVHADVAALGYITQAQLLQARGDGASAIATLEAFADLARQRNFAVAVATHAAAAQARIALRQGDLATAAGWADGYAESRLEKEALTTTSRQSMLNAQFSLLTFSPMYLCEFEDLTLVRMMIALGQNDPDSPHIRDALGMLELLLQAAEAGKRTSSVIEICILQAHALQACGAREQALAALRRALTLAASEGYVRVFVDEGSPMAELLRDAHACGIAPSYIERLLAAFPTAEGRGLRTESAEPNHSVLNPQSSALIEPLTGRELEVLRLIADGASNRVIAEQLVITVGTVKRHINNLFDKLGVRSRTQAIRAARVLRLLEH
jgi:LuxR family maltose regulon positive regulatory protein